MVFSSSGPRKTQNSNVYESQADCVDSACRDGDTAEMIYIKDHSNTKVGAEDSKN